MLADGAPDHFALHCKCINVAMGLPQAQEDLATGIAQLHQLIAPLCDDLWANGEVFVDVAACHLVKKVIRLNILDGAAHLAAFQDIKFHPGADNALAADDGCDEAHKSLVVRVLDGGGRHLNLLDQFAFVGVQRVQPEHHVVFVGMGG